MHPFCLNLKPYRNGAGRLVWEIKQRGRSKRQSPQGYPTFEVARQAGNAALAALIAEWRQLPAGTGALTVTAPASMQALL